MFCVRLGSHAASCLAIGFLTLTFVTPSLATDHTDPIFGSVAWTAAGNPHIILRTIYVNSGATLTIGPGVVIRANPGTGIRNQGVLNAVGTAENPIMFTKNGATNWRGIILTSLTYDRTFTIDHCTIEYATAGLEEVGPYNAVGTITNAVFRNNATGIIGRSSLSLGSTQFIGNTTYGLRGYGVPGFADANVVFDGCGTGISIYGVPNLAWTQPVTIRNCTTAGFTLENCSQASVTNLTMVRNTGHYGAIRFVDCGNVSLGAGNVIGGAGQENSWPVSISIGSYLGADSVIPTTGNLRNDIQIAGGGSSAWTGNWRRFPGLRYVIADGFTISSGDSLTIDDGVEVRLAGGVSLYVVGSLLAAGTPPQGILLTRDGASAWGTLLFAGTGASSLSNCMIEYGTCATDVLASGRVSLNSCTLKNSSIGARVTGGTLQLASTTFSGNASGIVANGVMPMLLDAHISIDGSQTGLACSDIPSLVHRTPLAVRGCSVAGVSLTRCPGAVLDSITLQDNVGSMGAILLDGCSDVVLGPGNVIGGAAHDNSWPVSLVARAFLASTGVVPSAGNLRNAVQVVGGARSASGRWRHLPGLDYVLTSSLTIESGDSLTIDPGVRLCSAAGATIGVRGTLNAIGGEGAEIVLTRESAAKWGGLRSHTSGSTHLDHCLVENAITGLVGYLPAPVTIEHSTFTRNAEGIVGVGGALSLRWNRIIANEVHGLVAGSSPITFGMNPDEWNDIYGNGAGAPGADLRCSAADLAAPYVFWGSTDTLAIDNVIWDKQDDAALGVVDYLPFCSGQHDPTATYLADFHAARRGSAVLVRWRLSALPPGTVFHVWRNGPGSDRERLSTQALGASSEGEFLDTVPPQGPAEYWLQQVGGDGAALWFGPVSVDAVALPTMPRLGHNYPNPFNPRTTFDFSVPRTGYVSLAIHDLGGALVVKLVDGVLPAGEHSADWSGRDSHGRVMPSGVYCARLETDGGVRTVKITLAR